MNGAESVVRGRHAGGTEVYFANPGLAAPDMLDLRRPDLDFCALARGMGVPAPRVEDAAHLQRAIADAVREPGPTLTEAAPC